jgi:hypothetical protein
VADYEGVDVEDSNQRTEHLERKPIRTASAANELPVGSIIADITEPDAPAVACKAARGDWQFLGEGDRRYWSSEIFPSGDSEIHLRIVLLYQPPWSGAKESERVQP